ncbi:uncharacterized protein BP01DRAFT_43337 [Aspergillus saccharolyticus JOP 1030-1]|uniref:Uncharacterized protein n=1 Tax=Aspergillus saccharolyticus JOP 1030-1 TaxID=1450539 RepID=A0A318ZGN5_9EURO|nr:hypothetical protein BP01DRAFT_43337 [Aspergillus saccharolyticus JOP 1030-1]PYH45534.1 hypothetical protein BP01DRAFT_43337 [Aspergillus saccharolyticus JOP 1030-1]
MSHSSTTKTFKAAESSTANGGDQQKQCSDSPTTTAGQTSKPIDIAKKAAEGRQKLRLGSACYTAPNGTRFIRHNDLLKWAVGVKDKHDDLVVFMPVFVENPWKGLKPVLTTCAARY